MKVRDSPRTGDARPPATRATTSDPRRPYRALCDAAVVANDPVRRSSEPASGPSGAMRRFVARYGWRAYALPALTVITVVVFVVAQSSSSTAPPAAGPQVVASSAHAAGRTVSRPPVASGNSQLKVDRPGATSQNEALASDALPAGAIYTQRGAGTFRVLPGAGGVVGTGTVRHYTVEVEDGVTGVDLTAFARTVDSVLGDPESWTHRGSGVALQRIDTGTPEFRVTVTSSITVRQLCGYELRIETSCWAPDSDNRVTLNVARWVRGDAAYVGDLAAYHTYMINHETGHALGHSHANGCLASGLAPVMMQQTIGLKAANGVTCQANPWPFPNGAADAPGVEQPGT